MKRYFLALMIVLLFAMPAQGEDFKDYVAGLTANTSPAGTDVVPIVTPGSPNVTKKVTITNLTTAVTSGLATYTDPASNGTLLCSTGAGTTGTCGLIKGTMTDGYLCTYTASGTLIACNTNPATITGSCAPVELLPATTSPTAANLSICNGTTISNYGQTAATLEITLPTAAANLGFTAIVSDTIAQIWRFTAGSAIIYLDGSGSAVTKVGFASPVARNYFSCFTGKVGAAYNWFCASGVGTVATY